MKPKSLLKGEDESIDSFYHGRILVIQKKKGYRFSVDAPLLADFIQTRKTDEILELGTGNGIIPLLLSLKPFTRITSVEIQESLYDVARRNVRLNRLEDRVRLVLGDLRAFSPSKKFDVIFSNPPYIKRWRGHLSASAEKSIAKHELRCDILDIMGKVKELLKENGRAYFIFSARREDDFMQAAEKTGLKVKTLRFVHPRKKSRANLFLTECNFHSKRELLLPPLFLYDEEGRYTLEAQEIFSGRIHASSS